MNFGTFAEKTEDKCTTYTFFKQQLILEPKSCFTFPGPYVVQVKLNTTHFLYRQLNSSEPEVDNEILENEPKSCLMVA